MKQNKFKPGDRVIMYGSVGDESIVRIVEGYDRYGLVLVRSKQYNKHGKQTGSSHFAKYEGDLEFYHPMQRISKFEQFYDYEAEI